MSSIDSKSAVRDSAAATYSRRLPIRPVEATGVRLRDSDGRWCLDCLAGAVASGQPGQILPPPIIDDADVTVASDAFAAAVADAERQCPGRTVARASR